MPGDCDATYWLDDIKRNDFFMTHYGEVFMLALKPRYTMESVEMRAREENAYWQRAYNEYFHNPFGKPGNSFSLLRNINDGEEVTRLFSTINGRIGNRTLIKNKGGWLGYYVYDDSFHYIGGEHLGHGMQDLATETPKEQQARLLVERIYLELRKRLLSDIPRERVIGIPDGGENPAVIAAVMEHVMFKVMLPFTWGDKEFTDNVRSLLQRRDNYYHVKTGGAGICFIYDNDIVRKDLIGTADGNTIEGIVEEALQELNITRPTGFDATVEAGRAITSTLWEKLKAQQL